MVDGFVLPFTLLIVAIMLLISVSISTVLVKQIYFSNISRESQAAYYAADNALACAVSIDETYQENGLGIFPYDSTIATTLANKTNMQTRLDALNTIRSLNIPVLAPLAVSLNTIMCAQSVIFDTGGVSNFTAKDVFTHGSETGITSIFTMKMDLGDGTFRCAKVTVNKTASYKQIIAQGYSQCNRTSGFVERAVVYSTVN